MELILYTWISLISWASCSQSCQRSDDIMKTFLSDQTFFSGPWD